MPLRWKACVVGFSDRSIVRSCTRSGAPQNPAPRAMIRPVCRSVKRQRIPFGVRQPRMVIRSRCVSAKSMPTTTSHEVLLGLRCKPRYRPMATIEPNASHVARIESSDFARAEVSRFLYRIYAATTHNARVMTLSGKANISSGKRPVKSCNSSTVATTAATTIHSVTTTFLLSAPISLEYLLQR